MYTSSDRENDENELEQRRKFIALKLRLLIEAFRTRAERVKEKVIQIPPTPSPPPERTSEDPERGARPSFGSLFHDDAPEESNNDQLHSLLCCHVRRRFIPKMPAVLDPQSRIYISWLFVVTLCFLYNSWGVFLRVIFPYQRPSNLPYFMAADYFCDVVYLLDMLFFKTRIQYLDSGFWVSDPIKTRNHYFKKLMFKMDALSLAPLDLLYFKLGHNALFRLPRLLKIQTFWEFFNRVDAVARSPYVIRITRTLIYMMYLIHLNACAYYAISTWEGIASNTFVFAGVGNAYIRCLYFATKTATSTGKNPKPTNEYEYMFMTFSWLMGVFIFAFLIGQVRDIIANATQNNTQFRQLMDNTVEYMRRLNLPEDLQHRVRLWLNHTWESQKTLNESTILDALPKKMKTDIALQVHYDTLSKVQLFKDCDKALLQDLVLKIKPVLFLPGDFVCKKGQVGKEMYIVNKGLVEVKGGPDGSKVLATLSEGSVFGEISLLGIPGCNRRTADVQSKGFSNLFMLSKGDLWDALKVYPDAQSILKKKAQSIINAQSKTSNNGDAKSLHSSPIIVHPSPKTSTPKLLKTVIQAMPADSQCAKKLSGYVSKPSDIKVQDLIERENEKSPHEIANNGREGGNEIPGELEGGKNKVVKNLPPSENAPAKAASSGANRPGNKPKESSATSATSGNKPKKSSATALAGKSLKIAPLPGFVGEKESFSSEEPVKPSRSNGTKSDRRYVKSEMHVKNCISQVDSKATSESKIINPESKTFPIEAGPKTRTEIKYDYEKTKSFSYKERVFLSKSVVKNQTINNTSESCKGREQDFSMAKLNKRVTKEIKVTVEKDSSKFDYQESIIRKIFSKRKQNLSKFANDVPQRCDVLSSDDTNKMKPVKSAMLNQPKVESSVPPVEDAGNDLKDAFNFKNTLERRKRAERSKANNNNNGGTQGSDNKGNDDSSCDQATTYSSDIPTSPTLFPSSTSSSGLSLDGFDILGIVPSNILEESSRTSSDLNEDL